jgi:FkbM family methyltransferase
VNSENAELGRVFRALDHAGLGVVDIGSRDGLHSMYDEAASLVTAVGFEPDAHECHALNLRSERTGVFRSLKFLPYALGRCAEERTLHITRSAGNSSILTPNRSLLERFPDAGRFDMVDSVRIPVRALDAIRSDLPRHVDVLKLDTQGFELDVLAGAKRALSEEVVAIEVEVEFARLYEGQPLFRDIDAFMAECGFTLFKLRRLEWVRRDYQRQSRSTAGQIVFGDALYFKDPLSTEYRWQPANARQAEALVLLAILFDLHDFAHELVSARSIASLVDAEAIKKYIIRRRRRLAPLAQIRNVTDLMRWIKARLSSSASYGTHWARGDENFYTHVRRVY